MKTYSLDKLQHEVRDKLGCGDNERPWLIERLGVVFNITNFPHQRGQSSENRRRWCEDNVFIAALLHHLPTEAPVEAVDEPLTDGAEVSDIGHHCAVSGVSL